MSEVLLLDIPRVQRRKREVLQGGQLSVPRGCNIGVAGMNGAGKTTMFMAISGALLRNSSGHARMSIAWVQQEIPTPRGITVRDYCEFVVGANFERAVTALDDDPLAVGLAQRRIANLSRGERQYLATIFALYSRAELILLDEPFSALDVQRSDRLLNRLCARTDLAAQTTVMLASQDLAILKKFSEHLIVVSSGVVSFDLDGSILEAALHPCPKFRAPGAAIA